MWYLPVIDRLKRLFKYPKNAKLMTWHANRPDKDDGKLRHPSDARRWKTFDANHEEFRNETMGLIHLVKEAAPTAYGQ
jgi:hypothetical protein